MLKYLVRSTSNSGDTWNLVMNDLDNRLDAEIVVKSLQLMKLKTNFLYQISEYDDY